MEMTNMSSIFFRLISNKRFFFSIMSRETGWFPVWEKPLTFSVYSFKIPTVLNFGSCFFFLISMFEHKQFLPWCHIDFVNILQRWVCIRLFFLLLHTLSSHSLSTCFHVLHRGKNQTREIYDTSSWPGLVWACRKKFHLLNQYFLILRLFYAIT